MNKKPSHLIRLMGAAYERQDFMRVSALFLELKRHPQLLAVHKALGESTFGHSLKKAVTASSLEMQAYHLGLSLAQGLSEVVVSEVSEQTSLVASYYPTKDPFLETEPVSHNDVWGTLKVKKIVPQEHLSTRESRLEYLHDELLPEAIRIQIPGLSLNPKFIFYRFADTLFVTDIDGSDLYYVCFYVKDSNQYIKGATVKIVWKHPKVNFVSYGALTKSVYLNYLLKKRTKCLISDEIQSEDAVRVWEQTMRAALLQGLSVGAGRLDSNKRSYCPPDKFDAWYKKAKLAVYDLYPKSARFFITRVYKVPAHLESTSLREVFPD